MAWLLMTEDDSEIIFMADLILKSNLGEWDISAGVSMSTFSSHFPSDLSISQEELHSRTKLLF
jgi:hypothetical protein